MTTDQLEVFSTEQLRRATALMLVHQLFPGHSPDVAHKLARWIVAGGAA